MKTELAVFDMDGTILDTLGDLKNSLNVFKALEEKVARWDYEYTGKLIAERKFEQLEMYTMNLLIGIDK